ncbi:hypothetical protein TcBrA4_0023560 [Trypanosoma cruzi]|nr:hypothetical protein TcBrA4_0023560 [Trypanosoma cruzi]
MLLSTWTPVQHRCGGSSSSAHPHSTNASRVSGIWRTCVAQPRLETIPSSILGKAATTISLPGDAVLNGPRRVRHHMLSTALLPGTLRAAAGWAYSSHGAPRTPWTVSDDRPLKRRTPLRDRVSGSAALPLDSPDSGAPCGPHRAASCSLACSCRAECPATEHGHRQFPVPRLAAASQSPTQVPVARDSLSAMEAL